MALFFVVGGCADVIAGDPDAGVDSGTVDFNLTVFLDGSGDGMVTSSPSGISCGNECTQDFSSGTEVTLTASPIGSSSFAGWSGECSGTGSCVVTMDAAKSVTASFNPPGFYSLSATLAGNGAGTVTSNPAGITCGIDCTEEYVENSVVTLSAAENTGSTFAGWSGGGCSGVGTCTVTVTAATSVTATFTLDQYTLIVSKAGTGNGTVTSSPSGINCGADCSQVYDHGTEVTLSATASTDSTFAGWSGGGCSGVGTCTVTVTVATAVTATFTMRVFPCTEQGIKEAIAQGGGPHTFDCNGPATVTTGAEIVIKPVGRNDVTLDGEGNLTIDGNDDHRVLSVAPGVTAELVGITVRNGLVQSDQQGLGILNEGTLTIRDSIVESNAVDDGTGIQGGGIYSSGTLSVFNSAVRGNVLYSGNSVDEGGAGIYSTGTATVVGSEVSGNFAISGTCGIHSTGTLTLIDTEVVDNSCGDGPAIRSNAGSLTLIRSTVGASDYWAIRGSGTATVINSTIEGGQVDPAIRHEGGGAFTLISSTVRGIDGALTGGDFVVSNSVIAIDDPNGIGNACGEVITSGGGNIESPGQSCGFNQLTDLDDVSAAALNLGPFADWGGPTMTRALFVGSVAIDHVPTSMCVDENGDRLMTDQRGRTRPQGVACDAGAYEW